MPLKALEHGNSHLATSHMEQGGSEQQNLKPNIKSTHITNRLEDPASAIYLNDEKSHIGFRQSEEFPGSNYTLQAHYQSSGDNFSQDLPEQDTLESMVKPHLGGNLCNRSSKFYTTSCSNFSGNGYPTSDRTQKMIQESLFSAQKMQSSGFVSVPCTSSADSSGPILSSKKRIRWTQDMHESFVQCVNYLGGAEKATPKAILKLMKSKELSIIQIKSHLQKYRSEKYMSESVQGNPKKPEKRDCISDLPQLYMITGIQIKEALQMQLEAQKQLHEQLEIQRKLQMMIEEQEKQVKKMILEKQQKANKRRL